MIRAILELRAWALSHGLPLPKITVEWPTEYHQRWAMDQLRQDAFVVPSLGVDMNPLAVTRIAEVEVSFTHG